MSFLLDVFSNWEFLSVRKRKTLSSPQGWAGNEQTNNTRTRRICFFWEFHMREDTGPQSTYFCVLWVSREGQCETIFFLHMTSACLPVAASFGFWLSYDGIEGTDAGWEEWWCSACLTLNQEPLTKMKHVTWPGPALAGRKTPTWTSCFSRHESWSTLEV